MREEDRDELKISRRKRKLGITIKSPIFVPGCLLNKPRVEKEAVIEAES